MENTPEYELVKMVWKAFSDMPLTAIDWCFHTLQNILREVKIHLGENNFSIPHNKRFKHLYEEAGDSNKETVTDGKLDDNNNKKPAPLCKPYCKAEVMDNNNEEALV